MELNYENCRCCPRQCGVDRTRGEIGFCRMGSRVRVAWAAPHFGEEPCLSGTRGSGAIFFVGCTLRCVYCQNAAISRGQGGEEVEEDRLVQLMLRLQEQGCHNINLVTASHFLPTVIPALRRAKRDGLRLPVVYNCGGYERVEALRQLDGLVDVYLPDFEYYSSYYGAQLSAALDYYEVALAALEEMVRQCGPLTLDADGLARRGVLVRHLLLPGLGQDTRQILRGLRARFGDGIAISLMGQYTPPRNLPPSHPLGNRITAEEYARAVEWMQRLGLSGYGQALSSATEEYIPDFTGPLA